MTKTFLLALSLLVSAAWVQAQSQYPQTQTGSSQTGATASGQTTVKGCLQGSDGNYTLMADNGTTYQLQGDTSKLSAHVGHEVQITGSTTSGSASSNPAGSTSNAAGTSATGTQQATLAVESMKHISKTCKSASK